MKKGATIQASLYSGSSFVFVKVLMEMFVKTFIESLISEPDEDPMDQYRVKPKEKYTGKDNSNSKEEKCGECDRTFPTSHGLNIHIGKAHKKNDSIVKRKRNEEIIEDEKVTKRIKLKEMVAETIECDNCCLTFRYKKSYDWHLKKCTEQRKENITKTDKIINIYKSCPGCDYVVEAIDFTSLLEHMQKHNSSCKAANVTKVSNNINLSENDFETVVKGVQKLQFDDQNTKINDQYRCTECSF